MRIKDLLLQALETEIGGQEVYRVALECASNPDLQQEWEKYLAQTTEHEDVVRKLLETLGIDPDEETPGRMIVRFQGESLANSMKLALESGDDGAAQLVAVECVVLAETKDHHNWELIGELAKHMKGEERLALKEAHDKVEDEEDEHLYHTKGWARELWIEALGMRAVLPPPEEKKDVKTAIGAARAQQARSHMS
jgi:rubrerythrin